MPSLIRKRIIWTLTLLAFHTLGWSQTLPISNLRAKWITISRDTIQIDTLSLVPYTLSVDGLDTSWYSVDPANATLLWRKFPAVDSIQISYRVLSVKINAVSQRMMFDTVMQKFIITPLEMRKSTQRENTLDFGTLNYNGSFGRSLSFGNRQDVVVNSSLNLQLNGYLGDSILLAAAISDNNIPIQPDGNTRNLNEFDRVFIQFSKKPWRLSVGDIDIRQQQGSYLQFYKRLQGLMYEQEHRISEKVQNKLLTSAAVAKGKFTRNIFNGLEGNQGPYRLKGAGNELFFIVLAGTERVWIDGVQMQRGEDQDYVINYNTAEVTFTPRQMITKDKRIQIEFEYADRNYLNTQLYLSDELTVGSKLKIRVGAFQNRDARNGSINQLLDTRQKQFLAQVGDSIRNAYYQSAIPDTFASGKVLYMRKDTVYNGKRDTIYIYSADRSVELYSLSFADVGQGRGDYILDYNGKANGKIYRWVAPDASGNKKGNYIPAVLLIAPRSQQMATAGMDYDDGKWQVRTELAWSKLDVNTFSIKDKGNDQGLAGKINLSRTIVVGGRKGLMVKSDIYGEHAGKTFRPIERLRSVEFNRDWGLSLEPELADENILKGTIDISDQHQHKFQYAVAYFQRGNGLKATKHQIIQKAYPKGWKIDNQLQYTTLQSITRKGYFLRPFIDISKELKKLNNYRIGLHYELEHNEQRDLSSKELDLQSFSFDVFKAYIQSPTGPNNWGFNFFTRADKLPVSQRWIPVDRSLNYQLFTELMGNEHHQFRLNTTFRKLVIKDSTISVNQPDATLLGRGEYLANIWKGGITGNILYELGTGQEPRREFAYLEVPAGQGEYTWIDYNGDGLQQINEFEVARFRDQARFIRIFTPTLDFQKANYLQFNYSFIFNPRAAISPNRGKPMDFLRRIYFQSAMQMARKDVAQKLAAFNPFAVALSDSGLLTMDQLFSNTLSFNRYSSVWGVDLNNIYNTSRAFLSFGYEARSLVDWNLKIRANFKKKYTGDIILKQIMNRLITPRFDNRNYAIRGYVAEPRFSYTLDTRFRALIGLRWENKANGNLERSVSRALNIESKYNVFSNTALTGKITVNDIMYKGASNTAIAYFMLDGLQSGSNFLWNLDLTKRLGTSLELNVQYEGRKSGNSGVIQVGRAQLRALF